MSKETEETLTDEQVIEEICQTALWKSPWYWLSDFLVASYVTICLTTMAVVFGARLMAVYFLIIIPLAIIYDFVWKKTRLAIQKDKEKFIRIFITGKFDERDEDISFSIMQRGYLISLLSLQPIFLWYEGLYGELALSILLGAVIFSGEYFSIRKSIKFLTTMNSNNSPNNPYSEIGQKNFRRIYSTAEGGGDYGSFVMFTKFFSILYILFSYSLLFIFMFSFIGLSMPDRVHTTEDVLMSSVGSPFVMLLFIRIIQFSAIAVRAREVAKLYLKIHNVRLWRWGDTKSPSI